MNIFMSHCIRIVLNILLLYSTLAMLKLFYIDLLNLSQLT